MVKEQKKVMNANMLESNSIKIQDYKNTKKNISKRVQEYNSTRVIHW